MSRPGITTVVVSCGLDRLLHVCLGALDRALAPRRPGAPDRTVVVDNASPQPYPAGRIEALGASLLRFDAPTSFAHACNEGFRAQPNDLVLLLNNDVLLEPDAIQAMVRVLDEDPGVGICGLRLLFPDGTLQHGGVVFGDGAVGPYHWARRLPDDAVPRDNRAFQAVTGACALIRNELWQALGGLDVSYPFGLEDVDFCLRALATGARIVCCHEADGLHFESMTPGRVEKDKPSRRLFMERWRGRYGIDG
jgi:GT2 family glycosyltransferase